MAQQYPELSDRHIDFIQEQKLYFVGTATDESRINISPKGIDSLRVLDTNRVVWLNLTGSGNESSAHVQLNPRMTIMFAAFEGNPMILRLYGKARVIHKNDTQWNDLYKLFPESNGARQIFDLDIDLVQTSCGMGVPLYDYVDERNQLNKWAEKKADAQLHEYWKARNQTSIDGLPTNIVEKNG